MTTPNEIHLDGWVIERYGNDWLVYRGEEIIPEFVTGRLDNAYGYVKTESAAAALTLNTEEDAEMTDAELDGMVNAIEERTQRTRYVYGGAWIAEDWQRDQFPGFLFTHPINSATVLICDEVDSSATPYPLPYAWLGEDAGGWVKVRDGLWIADRCIPDEHGRANWATMRREEDAES